METAVKNTRVEFKLAEGITKSQVATMATNAVDAVLERGNILQVAEVLSGMENFIKAVKADPPLPGLCPRRAGQVFGQIYHRLRG